MAGNKYAWKQAKYLEILGKSKEKVKVITYCYHSTTAGLKYITRASSGMFSGGKGSKLQNDILPQASKWSVDFISFP